MNIGHHLISEYGKTYGLKAGQPYSYQNTIGQGVRFTANFNYIIPRTYAPYTKFYIKAMLGSYIWTSPPLTISAPRNGNKGRGGSSSSFSGIDWTTYVLSQKAIDKPDYINTWTDIIIRDLGSNIEIAEGITVSVTFAGTLPHYYIEKCRVQDGSRLEHISRLLHDYGYTFYIADNDAFTVVPMDYFTEAGTSIKWVNSIDFSDDPSQEITRLKIIKTSSVQTHYSFPIMIPAESVNGPERKSVTFQTPFKSVTAKCENISGYVDELAFFNETDISHAQQVGQVILFFPDDHIGTTYPAGTGSGPIKSASFWVYPPKDENGNYKTDEDINVTVMFEGIPENETEAETDNTFEVVEDISNLATGYYTRNWTITYDYQSTQYQINVVEEQVEGFSYFYYRNLYFESLTHLMSIINYDSIISQTPSGAYSYVEFAKPIRPADNDDYIDGVLMPNINHANNMKKRALYNKIKGHYTANLKGAIPIPILPLFETFNCPGEPKLRAESVQFDGRSTIVKCHPVIWW